MLSGIVAFAAVTAMRRYTDGESKHIVVFAAASAEWQRFAGCDALRWEGLAPIPLCRAA